MGMDLKDCKSYLILFYVHSLHCSSSESIPGPTVETQAVTISNTVNAAVAPTASQASSSRSNTRVAGSTVPVPITVNIIDTLSADLVATILFFSTEKI